MADDVKPRCCARVMTGYHEVQCRNSGRVHYEDRWYCGTHDPKKIKERDLRRAAAHRAQVAERMARHRMIAEHPRLVARVAALEAALGEIVAHHVAQNKIKFRDESRSTTLRIARKALENK